MPPTLPMPLDESPSVSVSRCGNNDPRRTVVWLRGDHDIATRAELLETIARVARLDGADVVVDLSGVTFMGVSTIGALVVADDHLRASSRSLSVRVPSARTRRLLDLFGLERLIEEHPAQTQPTSAHSSGAPALGSWVDVPTRRPVVGEAPSSEPGHSTQRRVEPTGSVEPRRAPS